MDILPSIIYKGISQNIGAKMKINQYFNPQLTENYCDLHYHTLDEEVQALLAFGQAAGRISGKREKEIRLLLPQDIFYCEIVDRKCYAYLETEVWKVEEGIQLLADRYALAGFVRISKSMLVNIHKIERLKSEFNMKVNIILENNETIVLNRGYRSQFFQYLSAYAANGKKKRESE